MFTNGRAIDVADNGRARHNNDDDTLTDDVTTGRQIAARHNVDNIAANVYNNTKLRRADEQCHVTTHD